MLKNILLGSVVFVTLGMSAPAAIAAEGHGSPELPAVDWSFDGPFGAYDRASLQRGFQVYKQVCSACHSLKRVYYRNLEALGYDESQVKAVAADVMVQDGPNDEGEMFERAGRPSDHFKSPFPNDQAAKFANNGALPPDLSLITKARANGPDYVHALMIGYEPAPEGEELTPSQHWNKYFPGHKISMAAPLADGMIAYEDGTDGTVDQYAKDVVTFLNWAAEPELEKRKQTGIKVILFLAIFAGIMYAVKKKVWANLH